MRTLLLLVCMLRPVPSGADTEGVMEKNNLGSDDLSGLYRALDLDF